VSLDKARLNSLDSTTYLVFKILSAARLPPCAD